MKPVRNLIEEKLCFSTSSVLDSKTHKYENNTKPTNRLYFQLPTIYQSFSFRK